MNVKVIEIVEEHLGWGWSPEKMQEEHPEFTLAQLYSALAYFYDHEAEMRSDLRRQDEEFASRARGN
jgi:uncharacterized protein (DUF433 family)